MTPRRPCSPPLNHQSLQEMKAKNKLNQQQFHLTCENEARNLEIEDETAFKSRYCALLKAKSKETTFNNVKLNRKVHYTKGGPQDVIRIRLKKLRHSRIELNRRRATTKNASNDPDDYGYADATNDMSDKDDAAERDDHIVEDVDIDQSLDYDSTIGVDDDAHEMVCDLESVDDSIDIDDVEEAQEDEPTGYESSCNASIASDDSDAADIDVDHEENYIGDELSKSMIKTEGQRWKDSKVKKQAFPSNPNAVSAFEQILSRLQEKHTDILFTKERMDFSSVETKGVERLLTDLQIGNLTK